MMSLGKIEDTSFSDEKVFHVAPHFEGLHKMKTIVLFRGLYANPIQNGGPSQKIQSTDFDRPQCL